MKQTFTAKITTDCRVTLPEEIRRKLHLKPQDELVFEIHQDKTILLKKKLSAFWESVAQHVDEFGKVIDDELDWGEDVGAEVIDWGDDDE